MIDLVGIRQRFAAVCELLDERSRRLVVAAEASVLGHGGISAVAQATGVSRPVIRQGMQELESGEGPAIGRVRREGGGRKRIVEQDTTLRRDLAGC